MGREIKARGGDSEMKSPGIEKVGGKKSKTKGQGWGDCGREKNQKRRGL